MEPRQYKAGGAGIAMVYAIGECWLGPVLAAATPAGICAIVFGETKEDLLNDLGGRFPAAEIAPADATFSEQFAQILKALEAPHLASRLPLDILGTTFQQRVWAALRQIAPGETATYTQIAERIGSPRAVRAVASACAANHVAIAIPCHRVIRGNGDLAGYRWGLERKRALLEREKDKPSARKAASRPSKAG
jgi:AraC family transcriptional regulator of adaptative response/methylated-DNA-[protein]-cysteine methyltransferase